MHSTYLRTLIRIIPSALGGLVAGCILVGLALSFWGFLGAPSFDAFVVRWSLGLYVALFAAAAGAGLTLLYGAPVYAALVQISRASYFSAALIGVSPGALAALLGRGLWPAYAAFGGVVALCTHLLARRHGPNKSFKPTPLRGSA